jgi:hypothetical protein
MPDQTLLQQRQAGIVEPVHGRRVACDGAPRYGCRLNRWSGHERFGAGINERWIGIAIIIGETEDVSPSTQKAGISGLDNPGCGS